MDNSLQRRPRDFSKVYPYAKAESRGHVDCVYRV
jgi:hypothetical protein